MVKEVYDRLGPFKFTYSSPNNWKEPTIQDDGVYHGQWREEQKEGMGRQLSRDGSIFEGYWKSDNPNGTGRKIFNNGEVYEGDWVDGRMEGKGVFFR
jgi:hypothetical protein